MAAVPDPYRVLGLPRDATLDDVKRAYRRLAKEHHPDSGGERALPRFLQIQAAYEQLVGPAAHGRSGRSGRPDAARAPWEADDVRAEATRRAYGTRSRRTTGRPRSVPPDPEEAARERPRRRGRPPNKATPGSTTYDGAEDEPFEPGWAGASWYGTTSGTYWTVNPREYADPRKHGPEYQARARRNRAAAGGEAEPDPDVPPAAGPGPEPRPTPEAGLGGGREPRAAWSSTPETGPDASWSAAGDARPARPAPDPFDPASSLSDVARVLLRDPATPPARLALAVIGGAPLGLGLAWLLGELTGCGRFAATCDPGIVSFAWLAAAGIIAVLALLPALASVTSVGTVMLFVAGIPATVLLSATGGARLPEVSSAALGAVLVVGWLAGVAYATARRRGSSPDRPVS